MRLRLLIFMIALLPAPALAADERRLSAAEVEQILDKAAQKREAPTIARPVDKAKPPARPIEGEVGVSVGSGGIAKCLEPQSSRSAKMAWRSSRSTAPSRAAIIGVGASRR